MYHTMSELEALSLDELKAMAKEREEMAQMRLTLNEDGEADVKVESARPPISPDRTARKIEQAKSKMDIDVMDRSNEVTDKTQETSGIRKGRKINKKTGKLEEPEEKLEKIEDVIKEVTDDTIRVDLKKKDE